MKKIPDNLRIEKYCPSCGSGAKMVVRTNHQNDSQFLGCPNWPECNRTEPIPESIMMQFAGQPRLL